MKHQFDGLFALGINGRRATATDTGSFGKKTKMKLVGEAVLTHFSRFTLKSSPFQRGAGWGILIIFALFLSACGSQPSPPPTINPTEINIIDATAPAVAPAITARVLPTLYPTNTPPPTLILPPTNIPQPTVPVATGVPLDTVVIAMRYAIPSLGLARRLEATANSQITLTDEASGQRVVLNNQGPILLELQTSLGPLVLEPVPSDCRNCVSFDFNMPLSDIREVGWLQNEQILASVENFFALHLGPHFPEGTVLGLRRSASSYDVAQTVAINADGEARAWLATEAEVSEVIAGVDFAPVLVDLDMDLVADVYDVACFGRAVETMLIQEKMVLFRCPELSLPGDLVPAFSTLSSLLATLDNPNALPIPREKISINADLFYRRADGNSLTLFADGQLIVTDNLGTIATATISGTTGISLTQSILGLDSFTNDAAVLLSPGGEDAPDYQFLNVLVVRGATKVMGDGWNEDVPGDLLPALITLNTLLDNNIATISSSTNVTNSVTITASTTISE